MRHKLQRTLTCIVAIISFGMLVIVFPHNAFAASLSVSLSNSNILEIQPHINGITTGTSTAKLSVVTENIENYSVYISTTNGESTLKSVDSNNPHAISSIAVDTQIDNFAANTWGYSLSSSLPDSDTLFSAVPTANATPVLADVIPSGNDNFYLSIGTAIDLSLPTGTYENEVTVSVVASPATLTISQLTYMQDVTTENCMKSADGETAQLIDFRDGKRYWIAKLADGYCWMTQNLDLDITSAGLSHADSDITTVWDATSEFPPQDTLHSITEIAGDSSSTTNTLSWDIGTYVLKYPQKGVTCSDGSGDKYATENLSNCSDFVKIDTSWVADYISNSDSGLYTSVNEAAKQYDPHYLVGNYYQWNAATAGSGGIITNTNAADSVCPKGWGLPAYGLTTDGSFYNLLEKYGVETSVINGAQNIAADPLYFVRSGFINISNNQLRYAGVNGYNWSSAAYSDTEDAYNFVFNANTVYSSTNHRYRYLGFPVRCIVK